MSHTPGPWRIERMHQGVFAANVPKDGGDLICDPPEYAEASMARWPANARLIAAAPDLLEALKQLVANYHPDYMSQARAVLWGRARAAIEKAES